MSEVKSMIATLNDVIKRAEDEKNKLLQSMSPEQVKLFNEFQVNMAVLTKAKDINGIKELIKKFNKDNDELQRNTTKVQQRVPKWKQFLNRLFDRLFG